MKKFFFELLKLYLFWMLFFLVGRTIFLLTHTAMLGGIPFGEVMKVYFYALKLDTSATCYLMVPVFFADVPATCGKMEMDRHCQESADGHNADCGLAGYFWGNRDV